MVFSSILVWKPCHQCMSKNLSVLLTQKCWSPHHFSDCLEKKKKEEEVLYGLCDDVLLVKHYPSTQPFYLCLIDGASGSP